MSTIKVYEVFTKVGQGHWLSGDSALACRCNKLHSTICTPKPLTVWITIYVENSKAHGNTRPPSMPLRNLYAGQESTVRTGHGTTDWFQIGKGVRQAWHVFMGSQSVGH